MIGSIKILKKNKIMTTNIFKLAAVLLLLAGSFYSCAKKDCQCEDLPNCHLDENLTVYAWTESEKKYYFGGGNKIFLEIDPSRVVVRFDKRCFAEVQAFLQKNNQIQHIELGERYHYLVLTMKNPNMDIRALRKEFSKQTGVKSVNPMYLYIIEEHSICEDMVITDEINVQFKEDVSQQEIDKINHKYCIEIKEIGRRSHLLSVPVDLDPLEVANAYQISGLANYSLPNFIVNNYTF